MKIISLGSYVKKQHVSLGAELFSRSYNIGDWNYIKITAIQFGHFNSLLCSVSH